MYFITEKTTKTGKKFQKISDRIVEANKATINFAKKHGFKAWRPAYWVAAGGISSCGEFEKTPDPKIWGKGEAPYEFFPKRSSKAGKAIYKEIEELPKVRIHDLNDCIGFEEDAFKTIGFAHNHDKYFGFTAKEDWDIKVPNDCKEITYTEYKKIFRD